jgi:hypothetical protein
MFEISRKSKAKVVGIVGPESIDDLLRAKDAEREALFLPNHRINNSDCYCYLI